MMVYTSGLLYETASPVNGWLSGLREDLSQGADGMDLREAAAYWLGCLPEDDRGDQAYHARRVLSRLAGELNPFDPSNYL